MGNHQSQEPVPSAITSHLSQKAKTKLSEQRPSLKQLFSNHHHQQQKKKKINADDQCPTPSSLSSHSCSLSAEYTMINGRKYIHTPQSFYFLPCDEDESDRLIVLHFLLKYAFGGNYISPVRSLLQGSFYDRPKVLDIGTGAGTWILEMASEFPSTDFYGIDIATMYPSAIKPNNAYFQQHDMMDGLPFEDESMDFIFMRQMMTSMTRPQLIQILSEIARVLKPNGYLEIVDVEYQIQRPGPVSAALMNHDLKEKLKSEGIDFELCTQLSTLLMTTQTTKGGFVDTRQQRMTMPLGWGGHLADLHATSLSQYLKSLHPSVTSAIRTTKQLSTWSPPCMEHTTTNLLTDAAIQHMLAECKKYQSHLNWYAFTARKSSSSSSSSSTTATTPIAATAAGSKSTVYHIDKPMPPTPPLDPLEWESINSFVTGYVE
ncbi:uncharacterized protein BX664DRAFT_388345 [Halteromyces radiatus]|uniref:uncharacterized protein n=1 Tax=Halteromyces radiatus TaxID=101107 RepID=UPI00221F4DC5|nr:uncharacterized protein BX664DRAFT_388345 [Halteromyces radiatus]KAI8081346.1 hypothetical protein BX664DRAFT_388345 [Halteromyces radiatus]